MGDAQMKILDGAGMLMRATGQVEKAKAFEGIKCRIATLTAERDALRAQVEALRSDLTKIAFLRPGGPTPKTVKGELIERIETIALAALDKSTGSPDG